jgi:Glycine cleavage system T protein (aminomethyltransferase)
MNVAMAYVRKSFAKNGTSLMFKRGKKDIECTVSKMPFNPTNYYN